MQFNIKYLLNFLIKIQNAYYLSVQVTVYRLICKETVEEKILQRASQKNTVQQLVMTGGHVQGDLLAPEDVVSLLLDDAQLEQKLREVPSQVRFKFVGC